MATAGWPSGTAHALPASHAATEIESLIDHVSGLTSARFRGGRFEVGSANAARFLRHELAAKGERVNTAEEFIRWCATSSDSTGRVYEVVLPGGVVQPAAELLSDVLRQLRTKRP